MADTLDRAKLFRSGGVSLTDLGITDGTNGQVLVTDGSGNLSFDTAASFQSGIPATTVTSSRILTSDDAGKLVRLEGGAGATLELFTFNQGDVITLYNSHTSSVALDVSNVTAIYAGSEAVTNGLVTLSSYALCILVCVGEGEFVVSGVGVS